MDVVVLASTGHLGGTVSEHLTDTGHRRLALTRSTASGPGRSDRTDPASLRSAVTPDIHALALDLSVSGARARRELGWHRAPAVKDRRSDSYPLRRVGG